MKYFIKYYKFFGKDLKLLSKTSFIVFNCEFCNFKKIKKLFEDSLI